MHGATCWWPSIGRDQRPPIKSWCALAAKLAANCHQLAFSWAAMWHEQVHVAVLRVPQKRSDILVSLNTPTHIHSLSSSAQHTGPGQPAAAEDAEQVWSAVLRTLRIVDWGLFGE